MDSDGLTFDDEVRALGPTTSVGCAMGLAPFMLAGAAMSRKKIVTVRAIRWMHLGVCGGSCEADENANGVCDAEELAGCTVPSACNYNAFAGGRWFL